MIEPINTIDYGHAVELIRAVAKIAARTDYTQSEVVTASLAVLARDHAVIRGVDAIVSAEEMIEDAAQRLLELTYRSEMTFINRDHIRLDIQSIVDTSDADWQPEDIRLLVPCEMPWGKEKVVVVGKLNSVLAVEGRCVAAWDLEVLS